MLGIHKNNMIIAIDESGSFVSANTRNSWCVVAAYVFSERIKSRSLAALKKLKRATRVSDYEEIKLKNVTERNYFQFLFDLSKLNGVLFAVATDSHINTNDTLIEHRAVQANKIRENVPKMIYEEGKRGLSILSDEIDSL
ncbi:MAG: riboflavin biosynthesis protein RibD, partial [Betaproteobacteria bacterium]|nr:riboflavin biosynthesis protein RibD [Betaproteobacteria bacterium]